MAEQELMNAGGNSSEDELLKFLPDMDAEINLSESQVSEVLGGIREEVQQQQEEKARRMSVTNGVEVPAATGAVGAAAEKQGAFFDLEVQHKPHGASSFKKLKLAPPPAESTGETGACTRPHPGFFSSSREIWRPCGGVCACYDVDYGGTVQVGVVATVACLVGAAACDVSVGMLHVASTQMHALIRADPIPITSQTSVVNR